MTPFESLCDDFYVNMNLNTEMELPANREAVLHFFEQIQKPYPTMRNFYCREPGSHILEEDKDSGKYRWCAIEPRRICSGYVHPDNIEDAIQQHQLVLDLAPYNLSISQLDCEALDLLYGFDFSYRGNHNELVAEALGVTPGFDRLAELSDGAIVSYEPTITVAMDGDCRRQCRISIETRTNAYQIRTGEFTEDQFSVYVTTRQYGSLDKSTTYVQAFDQLTEFSETVLNNYVINNVLEPLAQTIALK